MRLAIVLVVSSCAASAPAPAPVVHLDVVDAGTAIVDAGEPVVAAREASAGPTLPAARAGLLVRFRGQRCFFDEPTDGGCGTGGACVATIEREVACPPERELLQIDVQEGLHGRLVIVVDGVGVFSEDVATASLTGRVASVRVRPRQWPAEVTVRAQKSTAHVMVPRATPFMAVHGPALTTSLSAKGFEYE